MSLLEEALEVEVKVYGDWKVRGHHLVLLELTVNCRIMGASKLSRYER